MRIPRLVWPALVLVIVACQQELYPEAPTVPSKNPSAVPITGPSSAPNAGPHGGQVMQSGTRYLEFYEQASQNNPGKIVYYFWPLDANQQTVTRRTTASGKMTITDPSNVTQTPDLTYYTPPADDPFFYTLLNQGPKGTYKVHASLNVDGVPFAGDFTFQTN